MNKYLDCSAVEHFKKLGDIDISPYAELCEMLDSPLSYTVPALDALHIAIECHKLQLRDGGERYIHHVLRVANSCVRYGLEAVVVALLHDTIEDGHITMEQLEAAMYISTCVKEALDDVTKRKNELYCDFIFRIEKSLSAVSKRVKIKDIADNSRGKKDNRYIKYQLSSRILEIALERMEKG